MSRMSYEEMTAFLTKPWIADLVTLRADGSPHVAPIWYEFVDGNFLIYTNRRFQRVRNIEGDSRAALSIASDVEPYAYVVAEGRVTVSQERVEEIGRSIALRYKQGEAAEQFLQQTLDDGAVVIELAPERTMTWVSDY